MKCIRCGHDSKYKDRSGMRCPACRGDFAFEPQKGAILTDAAFQHAVDAVSANGSVKWGVEHLYYEVCRRPTGKPLGRALVAGLVAFVAVTLAVTLFLKDDALGLPLVKVHGLAAFMGLLTALLVIVLVDRLMPRTVGPTVTVPLATFDQMWQRWTTVHGTPKGVIARKLKEGRRPRAPEPDLGHYSFDRAVICDRARTADLLLANNFHFENNCAVLSIGGYPEGPFETVRAMLRRNPRLRVFALHDASPAGCKLPHRLATDAAWFKNLVPVTDVGLRPAQAAGLTGLFLRADGGRVAAIEGISPKEAEWLSRYTLELAAIRPEQVLKRLFRAISRKPEGPEDGGTSSGGSAGDGGGGESTGATVAAGHDRGGVEYDADSFGVDAGDTDGGADSFG